MKNKKFNKFIGLIVASSKFLKFILAGLSLSVYSYLFTWPFAIMLLLMIFIHEYGHVVAMRKCGIHVKGIYLIPFFGGVAVADDNFKTRRDEAYIALMGPWYGFVVSAFFLLFYYLTKNPLFAAGATWCSMINLFNLFPINPLDGGRILKSLAFSINNISGIVFLFLSLIAMFFLILYFKIWLFLILLIMAVLELFFEVYSINKKTKELEKLKNNLENKINNTKTDLESLHYYKEKKIEVENEINKTIKPQMSLKQIILYSFLYLITCLFF